MVWTKKNVVGVFLTNTFSKIKTYLSEPKLVTFFLKIKLFLKILCLLTALVYKKKNTAAKQNINGWDLFLNLAPHKFANGSK